MSEVNFNPLLKNANTNRNKQVSQVPNQSRPGSSNVDRKTSYGEVATRNARDTSVKQMPIPKTATLDATIEMPDMGTVEIYKNEIRDRSGSTAGYAYYVKNNKEGSKQIILPARQSGQNGSSVEAFIVVPQNKSGAWSLKYDSLVQVGSSNSKHDDRVTYKFPFSGTRIVAQGEGGKLTHTGSNAFAIDFAMPEGSEVLAMRDGVVVSVKEDSNEGGGLHVASDKANHIHIYHPDDGSFAKYVHLKKNGVNVKVGQKIKAGELIGFSGNTGRSTSPHLHVQIDVPKGFNNSDLFPIKFQGSNGEPFKAEEGKSYRNPG